MRKLVIIPTYNERENIAAMIAHVLSLEGGFDLLVIDDGSPDGTASVVRAGQAGGGQAAAVEPTSGGQEDLVGSRDGAAQELQRTATAQRLHLIERNGKQGLGTAYLAGFRWALERGYDLIFEMDCDFSHDPNDLPRMAAEVEKGADVVVGSRYVKGGKVVNWPASRLMISYGASVYVRLATWMPVHDATAGFVCYSRRALESIDLGAVRMKGYGFQIEMKYTAWRLGMKIVEIPIVFTERRLGVSKMSGGIFGEAFFGVLKLPFRKKRRKHSSIN